MHKFEVEDESFTQDGYYHRSAKCKSNNGDYVLKHQVDEHNQPVVGIQHWGSGNTACIYLWPQEAKALAEEILKGLETLSPEIM